MESNTLNKRNFSFSKKSNNNQNADENTNINVETEINAYLNPLMKLDKKIFDFEYEINNLNSLNEIKREFFDFGSISHSKSFPPKDAYFYIPSEKEEFDLDENNNKISRKIFETKKGFTLQEIESLKNLKREIEKYNIENPQNKLEFPNNFPEYEILKIFQAGKFEIKTTINNLLAYVEFRKSFFPLKLKDKAIEILSTSGFLYCHGRDRSFRPIIICRAESYLNNLKKFSFDDWLNAIVYFSEYVIQYMLIPGQVETWNTIADLNNVSLFSLPTDFHKFVKFLQTNYRSRLNLSFVFGMNKVLDFLWRIIKKFLHVNVEKKIIFLNEENKDIIFDTIMPEQLEKKYGGKAENLFQADPNNQNENIFNVKSLFPPFMPNADFQTIVDKSRLISENDYVLLFKKGLISQLSPYIDLEYYEAKYFTTCQQKTSRTRTNGDVSVYEDALSHFNNTKLYSEINVNNDVSQYEICNDFKETTENYENKSNNNGNIFNNSQIRITKKTEENEEYLVAAQNTEEQSHYLTKKNTKIFDKIPTNGINLIVNRNINSKDFNNLNGEENNINEFEIKSSSFYVDGKNSIQLLLLDRKATPEQNELKYSRTCFNCDKDSKNLEYCLKCVINGKMKYNSNNSQHSLGNLNFISNIKEESQTKFSSANLNNVETARSFPVLGNKLKQENQINNNKEVINNFFEIEKVKGKYSLPFEKIEDNKFHSEPIFTDTNIRPNLRLEANSGANCCTDFNKKCLIF